MNYDNPAPQIYEQQNISGVEWEDRKQQELQGCSGESIDKVEVFDLVKNLNDPEHPLTLEQLKVVSLEDIWVSNERVEVQFTPTIPHCSMANMIGLMIIVKLKRSLPNRFKIDVTVKIGTHQNELELNKQLNDKERVMAA